MTTDRAAESTLKDRLRGIYNIPVNDGAGPLNGSMVFTRKFETPPIHHEAADYIELLEAELATLRAQVAALASERLKMTDRDLSANNRVLSNMWQMEYQTAHRELVVANRAVQRLSARCKRLRAAKSSEVKSGDKND